MGMSLISFVQLAHKIKRNCKSNLAEILGKTKDQGSAMWKLKTAFSNFCAGKEVR